MGILISTCRLSAINLQKAVLYHINQVFFHYAFINDSTASIVISSPITKFIISKYKLLQLKDEIK